MAVLRNLARVRSATVGAGALTLGVAVTGFLTFAQAGVLDGETVSYGIFDYDGAGNHTGSEVGRGVYNAGAGTLTRNVLDSTNGGAALNLSGNEHVFITILTEDMDHASGSIANVGTNTHAQIDTHIANMANPHSVTAVQVGAQPLDATLTSIALLGTVADRMLYTTGVDTWAETGLTAFARSILDDADEATFKATVNLEIGTDVQAYDATLAAIAGLSDASGVLTNDGAGNLSWGAGGSGLPVADTTAIVKGSVDATKLLRFEVDGFTTGMTRVITPPNADITLAGQNYANAFTAAQNINVNSTTAFLVEQDGVKDNTFIVDTTNAIALINTNATTYRDTNAGSDNSIRFMISSPDAGQNDKFQGVDMGTTSQSWNFIQNNSSGNRIRYAAFNAWMTSSIAGSETGVMRFYTKPSSGGVAERLRIDNSGNLSAPGRMALGFPAGTIPSEALDVALESSTTNNTISVIGLVAYSSGTVANGFGSNFLFRAETSTASTVQNQAAIVSSWIDATNNSRKADLKLYAYDTAARLGLTIEASGSAPKLSFYGGTTVVRGAALTTQLTTLTYTAPGTPDYALQDVTNVVPYGFADAEELRTFISVVKNLQDRVAEIDARLNATTGVNLWA